MKTLNDRELKSIEQFFQLTQDSLRKVMKQYLITKYKKVFSTEDYVVAIGDIPVALVAHMDTVFPKPPQDIYYDKNKNVMWSPDGLGADDRAGVYSIVQIVKAGYRPTIIFTADEEVGAIGALQLIEDFEDSITQLKYIIELDRRGSNDCVFYDCDNKDFEKYVESFGFVTNYGSFSDISVICPQWEVAGVNLSIGYCNEHSTSEILHIGKMLDTIEKVKKMLSDIDNAEFYKFIPNTYYYDYWYKPIENNKEDDWMSKYDPSYGITKAQWAKWGENQIKCAECRNYDYDYNLLPIKKVNGETMHLCSDCFANKADKINWCSICNEAFIYDKQVSDNTHTCPDCSKKKEGNKKQ